MSNKIKVNFKNYLINLEYICIYKIKSWITDQWYLKFNLLNIIQKVYDGICNLTKKKIYSENTFTNFQFLQAELYAFISVVIFIFRSIFANSPINLNLKQLKNLKKLTKIQFISRFA